MSKIKKVSFFDILVVFILIGITPFLVYFTEYEYTYIGQKTPKIFNDYFNLIKTRVITYTALTIVVYYVLDYLITEVNLFYNFKLKKYLTLKNAFILIIFLSVVIAFIFSDYKNVALTGAYQRFESIWVHFSYLVIFLFSVNFFKKENSFKYFSYAILLASFVVGVIGTFQFFDYNIILTDFFQKITTGGKTTLRSKAIGSYSTLYNTNTSASFSLLMMYILSIVILLNKNKVVKSIGLINFVLIFITFYNSFSEASYLALFLSIGFASMLLLIKILTVYDKRKIIVTVSSLIVIVSACFFFTINNEKFQETVISTFTKVDNFTDWQIIDNNFYFYNKDDDYILVTTTENSFLLFEGDTKLYEIYYDSPERKALNTSNFGSILVFSETQGNKNLLNFNDFFYISDNGNPSLLRKDYYTEIEYVDFLLFEGYSKLFTNRGYIWSRSLPLFLERPILGYGSDVYFHIFPNEDVAGRAFANFPTTYVDKPHSIFLNMAINNGIFYLVGFLGIVTLIFKEKIKLLFNKNVKINILALTLYISGIVAYMINGLTTDNLTIIILYFWVYLALDNKIFIDGSNSEIKKNKY